MAFLGESGSGKIIAELGLPGLVVISVIFILLSRSLWQNYNLMKSLPPQFCSIYIGLMAFSIANLPIFLTASQVYGDPFVLIILTLCLGSSLSLPALLSAFLRYQGQPEMSPSLASRSPV